MDPISGSTTRDLRIKILLIAGLFACTLYLFFPGSYSIDSWDQYKEMTTGRFEDWFDGGMAFTWHLLWKITGNFKSLYILYMILYWLLFLFLVWRIALRSAFFWVLLLLAVFFCFIPQYVMRDTLMGLLWGWAVAFLLIASRSGSRLMAVLALLLLAYGMWVRYNTLIAALPLLWISITFLLKRPLLRWQQGLLTLCACAGMFLAVRGLTYQMLHAKRTYPDYKLKLLDIGGISKLSGTDCFPSCIRDYPYFNFDTLLANYEPAGIDDLYWPPGNRRSIFPFPTRALDSCVTGSWIRTIGSHPFLYIDNRLSGYLDYLRIRKRLKNDEYYNTAIWIDPGNPLHLQPEPNGVRDRFVSLYKRLGPTFFYSPWFWLLLNTTAFAYFLSCYRRTNDRYWQVQLCIQLSGIMYMLSQFPVFQSDRDFRLCYWNVLVALIAISAMGLRSARHPSA